RRLAELEALTGSAPSAIASTAGSTLDGKREHRKAADFTSETTPEPAGDRGALPDWLGPPDPEPALQPRGIDTNELPIGAPRRVPEKADRALVASQPCLVCGKRPVDPHHIRFAQKQSLGRRVSDEFTIPLCRSHHRALHRSGSEYLWWENVGIDPLKAARKLWKKTRASREPRATSRRPGPHASKGHTVVTRPQAAAVAPPTIVAPSSATGAATPTRSTRSNLP